MVRNDGTISLGFVGCVKFQAAGLGPDKKLEQQKERHQQEQRKLHDQQESLVEELGFVNSQINSGMINKLTEGVGNSSIVPTIPPFSTGGGGDWPPRRAPLLPLRSWLTPKK